MNRVILDTETIGQLLGCTGATLEESATDESTLELVFAGEGPEWASYGTPVTVYHRGRAIFAGKIIRPEQRTAEGNALTTTVTAANLMWLLNRQTLGQQIADIVEAAEESQEGGSSSSAAAGCLCAGQIGAGAALSSSSGGGGGHASIGARSGGSTAVTWAKVTSTMGCTSSGWRATDAADGEAEEVVSVATSLSVGERVCWAVTDKLITTASALYRMRQKALDVQFIVDYEAGTVTATAIGDMGELTIDSGSHGIVSAEGIAPQYEDQVTGVAIVWTSSENKVFVHKYPPEIDEAADGVKVFSLSGGYFVGSWDTVAREYYEAANVLQWAGSVVLRAEVLSGSPLGHTLNLTGPGCHSSWATMRAAINAVSWDFLTGEVTLSLGRSFDDPEFADAEETEDGGDGDGDGGGDTGDGGGGDDAATTEDTEDGTHAIIPLNTLTGTPDENGLVLAYEATRADAMNFHCKLLFAVPEGAKEATLTIDSEEACGLTVEAGSLTVDFPYDTVHVALLSAVTAQGEKVSRQIRIYEENVYTGNTNTGGGNTNTGGGVNTNTGGGNTNTGGGNTNTGGGNTNTGGVNTNTGGVNTGGGTGCGCAARWTAQEAWNTETRKLMEQYRCRCCGTGTDAADTGGSLAERVKALEAAVKALTEAGSESITMEEVSAAINSALATVKVEVQAGGSLESTSFSTGSLTFTTTTQYA